MDKIYPLTNSPSSDTIGVSEEGEGERMQTEAAKRAVLKYDAKNTKQYHLKLNLKTDAQIIEHLRKKPNMQGYIKALILEDMKRHGA